MDKSKFRILVADDDEMVRGVIVKFLSEEGYHVVAASDGLEAIRYVRFEDFGLVLTDLRMPGADGMEVLREAVKMNPKIAVVVLTAYGTLDTALDAVKAGAYDYIVKPFVMQQLLLLVGNALRMGNLLEENEQLKTHLKETYRDLEKTRAAGGEITNDMMSMARSERIDMLEKLHMISESEAKFLREMTDPVHAIQNEDIKKYSTLIEGLKKEIL